MRRDGEFFGDTELTLVYVGRRLRDALRVEELLTAAGFDYVVETDLYTSGIIFRTEKVGAFFYVPTAAEDGARAAMVLKGFQPYRDRTPPS